MAICEGCEKLHDRSFWWDDANTILTCSICSKKYEVYGDCSYDEDSGDEDCWFWLEEYK